MSSQRLKIIKDKAVAMFATFLNKLLIELNYFGLFILYSVYQFINNLKLKKDVKSLILK